MENKGKKVSLQLFEETARNNGYEVFTPDEVASYYKEGIMKSRANELTAEEKEAFVADVMYLQKAVCWDGEKDVIRYFRKSQVAWEEAEDGTILKGFEGVYLDTPENRRLNRVGQAFSPTLDFLKSIDALEEDIMKSIDSNILKAVRTGRYANTPENRRLHRVGQPYKTRGKGDYGDKEIVNANKQRLDAANKVIERAKKDTTFKEKVISEIIKNNKWEDSEESIRKNWENHTEALSTETLKRLHQNAEKKESRDYDKHMAKLEKKANSEESVVLESKQALSSHFGKLSFRDEDGEEMAAEAGEGDSNKQLGDFGFLLNKKTGKVTLYNAVDGDDIMTGFPTNQVFVRKMKESMGFKASESTLESSKADPEPEAKEEESSEEAKESYTRVKFDDVPNSGKVNLKKYLLEKVRKGVDEKWSNIKNIPTDNLKKMEKGLVNDLNKNFEAIKKSQRAELLYSIMKVKGELEKRGKESQKKE